MMFASTRLSNDPASGAVLGDLKIGTGEAVTTLDEIKPADRQWVGAKAYNCARMRQAGFPVPVGCVVRPDATDLSDLEAWLRTLPQGVRLAVRFFGGGRRWLRPFVRRNPRNTPERGAIGRAGCRRGLSGIGRVGSGASVSQGSRSSRRKHRLCRPRSENARTGRLGRRVHDQSGHGP